MRHDGGPPWGGSKNAIYRTILNRIFFQKILQKILRIVVKKFSHGGLIHREESTFEGWKFWREMSSKVIKYKGWVDRRMSSLHILSESYLTKKKFFKNTSSTRSTSFKKIIEKNSNFFKKIFRRNVRSNFLAISEAYKNFDLIDVFQIYYLFKWWKFHLQHLYLWKV
jgi:hypothetical protein